MIATLLKAGADIEARDNDGMTALMYAAANNRNPEVITSLLKAGADVNAQSRYGVTALMYAANNKNPAVITTLLKAGADIEARDNDGRTALMWAARHNENPEVIMALAAANEGCVPMVEFTYGKFVRIGDAYACPHCRHDLEVTASRRPSWVLVEFKEGPGADRPLVQVPGFAVTP